MRNDVPNHPPRQTGYPTPSPPTNYHARHDPESTAKLSTTVVHALADVMGVDVSDVGFTLADDIDPDALDRLFSTIGDDRSAPAHVAFSVQGYRVTVHSNGEIVVTPPA